MNSLQLQFLMLIFAGWVNRSQQDVIEYLQEETGYSGNSWVESACGSLMHNADALHQRPRQLAEESSSRFVH